jgi:hypothetical protein
MRLVCAMPCKSRLSQLLGPAEDARQARVRGLSRLPAVLQGAEVRKIPTVCPPWRTSITPSAY